MMDNVMEKIGICAISLMIELTMVYSIVSGIEELKVATNSIMELALLIHLMICLAI